MFQPWSHRLLYSSVDVISCSFCVHILGLPRECYTMPVGKSIGNGFNGLYEIQVLQCKRPESVFFQLRVAIAVNWLLHRAIVLHLPIMMLSDGRFNMETSPLRCTWVWYSPYQTQTYIMKHGVKRSPRSDEYRIYGPRSYLLKSQVRSGYIRLEQLFFPIK